MDFVWYYDGLDSDLLKNMFNGIEIEKLVVDILKYWECVGIKDDLVE